MVVNTKEQITEKLNDTAYVAKAVEYMYDYDGFNKVDKYFGEGCARIVKNKKALSPKQIQSLQSMLVKYHATLVKIPTWY